MSEICIHFRHLMLYEFRKGSSVAIATKNICAVYGENALSSRTCRKWFQRFRTENFYLEDCRLSHTKQRLKRKIFIVYFRLSFSRRITPFPLVPPVTNHLIDSSCFTRNHKTFSYLSKSHFLISQN